VRGGGGEVTQESVLGKRKFSRVLCGERGLGEGWIKGEAYCRAMQQRTTNKSNMAHTHKHLINAKMAKQNSKWQSKK